MKISPFIFFSTLLIAFVFSCQKPEVVKQLDPLYKISKISGDAQTGAPFQTIHPLRLQVFIDSSNHIPAPNISVKFTVKAGGGNVDPATVQTDQQGFATTNWTLGDLENLQKVSAQAEYTSGPKFMSFPVEFTATSKLADYKIVKNSIGDVRFIQSVIPLSVYLIDSGSNKAIPNAMIEFSVISGGGSVNPSTAITNQNGSVQTTWTLGSQEGIQKVQVNSKYISGPKFTSRTTEYATTAIKSVILSIVSGDNQSAPAKELMSDNTVKVTNSSGTPVRGIPVSFQVISGGGSVAATSDVLTPETGIVSTQWTIGNQAGPQKLRASISGMPSVAPVEFTATSSGVPLNGTTVAGGNGGGNAANQLNKPRSIFVDNTGAIYIADTENHRVQKFTP